MNAQEEPLLRSTADVVEPAGDGSKSGFCAMRNVRGVSIITALVMVNIGLFVALVVMNSTVASLLSPGILAYTYGLRHAVDADHIAAIDNATRKLIADGKRPLCVGLWFSLGHASVVVIMCIIVSLSSNYMREHLSSTQSIGAVVGTAVSATVLFAIGGFNTYIAWGLLKRWRTMDDDNGFSSHSADGHIHEPWEDDGHTHLVTVTEDAEVEGPGALVKCCPRIFQAVDKEWKMYPIGFLFGLGFDTASEVAVLALAAIAPKKGMPPACVLILPLLFGAGMALIDTLDGMLMAYSYEFALAESKSKLFYNLYLTAVTGFIALAVGVIETLGCVQQEMNYSGPVWKFIGGINDNFEYVGYSIIGFFVLSLGAAMLYFKYCVRKPLTAEEFMQRAAAAVPIEEKNDPSFREENNEIKNLWRRAEYGTGNTRSRGEQQQGDEVVVPAPKQETPPPPVAPAAPATPVAAAGDGPAALPAHLRPMKSFY